MRSIKHFLDELEPMVPEPTGLEPSPDPVPGIKAVLFDIYGTLLVSASGDVGESSYSVRNVLKSFDACGIRIVSVDNELAARMIISEYLRQILEHNDLKNNNLHPESDIREVWTEVLRRLENTGVIENSESIDASKLAFIFELLSNPVYPMPGARKTIDALKKAGFILGVVSNAQFYTPRTMNYFLEGKLSEKDTIDAFDPRLQSYSYKLRKAKPDTELYSRLFDGLSEKGVSPAEVIFVGNDMLNDAYPASKTGFKTAVFAGDKRSLRLRETDERTRGLVPDATITELEQIVGKVRGDSQ